MREINPNDFKKNGYFHNSFSKGPELNLLNKKISDAFNKKELKKFNSGNQKGKLEEIEDIEILRFIENNIKIKMVKLNSNSVAVDEKKDVKKAEKIMIKSLKNLGYQKN